ncbi:hypothetical protein JZ751_022914 [Albula glossodonta]|uniref:Uncharacterized protein n=1 Tax=Albula glossodonta TaxID=121402 RepID=A0A8T2PE97_9TELE|nr:hypothetical protein JZ751_022914 [Albula glossodonta]
MCRLQQPRAAGLVVPVWGKHGSPPSSSIHPCVGPSAPLSLLSASHIDLALAVVTHR